MLAVVGVVALILLGRWRNARKVGGQGHVVLDAGYPTTARLVMASIAKLGFDITRGCTSWSFPVRDGDRTLNVVSACDLGVLVTSQYPEQAADRARSIRVLRNLPADIWVTCHARWWGRYRKFVASTTAKDPVELFIDREGYRAYLDAAEVELREGRMH